MMPSAARDLDKGKCVRYTPEQVAAMERVYAEFPKPNYWHRQQLVRDCPSLSVVEPKQIKVWFQNRRCRDKQRKETTRLQALNRKLSELNQLLKGDNSRLRRQVALLFRENSHMRDQIQIVIANEGILLLQAVNGPQNAALQYAGNPAGLVAIAHEVLVEFIAKATGNAINWIQAPGMKPGPDSITIMGTSQMGTAGLAARVCGFVNMDPIKVVEILKDRPSWFRDCRRMKVFTMFTAGNGGSIELVYMQMYASTTLIPARDFWTIRYTTSLEDGSIVVCERSLTGYGNSPHSFAEHQFARAEMFASGYLVRSCDDGGSIVHIVDHLNFEGLILPDMLRPLYDSSQAVARKMTTAALRHVRQIAQEKNDDMVYPLGREPSVFRTFSERLIRGYNEAVNGFTEDGWSIMRPDGVADIVICTNPNLRVGAHVNLANGLSVPRGVICVKTSLLIKNVPPALLIRYLRDYRAEWANFSIDAYNAAMLHPGSNSFPGLGSTVFHGSQTILPLAQTMEYEEVLELVRFEGRAITQEEGILSRVVPLLQLCSGIDENAVGACYQLLFAPVDEFLPVNASLLPSGFSVIPLDTGTDTNTSNHRLDLASSLETGSRANRPEEDRSSDECSLRSILTIAFQFPYEIHHQESVAAMAREHVRSIVSAVQRFSVAIQQPQLSMNMGRQLIPGSPETVTLARWIRQSYNYHLGVDFLRTDCQTGESLLQMLWNHQDPILCCSLKALPVLTFANQAGLDMLETSLVSLQDITLDKILNERGRNILCSEFRKLMEKGFLHLPAGSFLSRAGRPVTYEKSVAWKVLDEAHNSHCFAFSFINWYFVEDVLID